MLWCDGANSLTLPPKTTTTTQQPHNKKTKSQRTSKLKCHSTVSFSWCLCRWRLTFLGHSVRHPTLSGPAWPALSAACVSWEWWVCWWSHLLCCTEHERGMTGSGKKPGLCRGEAWWLLGSTGWWSVAGGVAWAAPTMESFWSNLWNQGERENNKQKMKEMKMSEG